MGKQYSLRFNERKTEMCPSDSDNVICMYINYMTSRLGVISLCLNYFDEINKHKDTCKIIYIYLKPVERMLTSIQCQTKKCGNLGICHNYCHFMIQVFIRICGIRREIIIM